MDKAKLMRLKELAHDMFDYLYDKEWKDMIFRGGVSKRQAAYIMAIDPKLIVDLIAENERLEKEANWLATRLEERDIADHYERRIELQEMNDKKDWREAARKAVKKK